MPPKLLRLKNKKSGLKRLKNFFNELYFHFSYKKTSTLNPCTCLHLRIMMYLIHLLLEWVIFVSPKATFFFFLYYSIFEVSSYHVFLKGVSC